MAKVGVILSGCGVYDGSEIHEAVITLLALDRAGVPHGLVVAAVLRDPEVDAVVAPEGTARRGQSDGWRPGAIVEEGFTFHCIDVHDGPGEGRGLQSASCRTPAHLADT